MTANASHAAEPFQIGGDPIRVHLPARAVDRAAEGDSAGHSSQTAQPPPPGSGWDRLTPAQASYRIRALWRSGRRLELFRP